MTGIAFASVRRRLVFLAPVSALLWFTPVVASPMVGAFERFYAGEKDETRMADGGLLLLNELNCVACHASPSGWSARLAGRGKISLLGVGGRLDAATLRDFVHDPHQVKSGTVMPELFAGHEASEAEAIAAYIASLYASTNERPAKPFPTGDAARGQRLYGSIGCVSCHAPSDGTTAFASVPIALAAHMPVAALAAFLQDPLHARPAARMPAFALSDSEAADLAVFLQRGKKAERAAEEKGQGTVDRPDGRALFKAMNCAACHDVGETVALTRATPLANVQSGRGCLAASPVAGVPNFALSEAQVRAITAALRRLQSDASPVATTAVQRVTEKFAQLNCYACHEWRGAGGIDETRGRQLVAAGSASESLGELGRQPPKLDSAGRKLTPMWLEKVLTGTGGGVRPYLSVRMPRFGAAHAAELIPLLAEACRPEHPEKIDTSGTKGNQRAETGRALIGAGDGGLGCVACHGLREREPSGVRAINLTHTAQRIQPEYFKALLLDPQGTQSGTIMPPLLTGRKNGASEIESIWTYLKEFDSNTRLPNGLIAADSYELKPETEGRPIIFRTFLRGAGTHAIAVGFPARVHVAFDALEVRWAIMWRGRFLDAQSNWEERSMPPVKPLGEEVRTFVTTMPLAQLREVSEPWPAAYGTAAGYVMKGYRLDADGAPTFRYAVGGLEVEDTLRPDAASGALRRTIRIHGAETNWFFRGIAADAPVQALVWKNGVAVFEETLTF